MTKVRDKEYVQIYYAISAKSHIYIFGSIHVNQIFSYNDFIFVVQNIFSNYLSNAEFRYSGIF